MSTGISLTLIAIGAILTFALEREAEGIDLNVVGIILMIVGILGLLVSALFVASWAPYGRSRRATYYREQEGPLV